MKEANKAITNYKAGYFRLLRFFRIVPTSSDYLCKECNDVMDKQKDKAFIKELGIPAKARIRTLTLTEQILGNKWKSYSVLLVGVLVDPILKTNLSFPVYYTNEPDGTESNILQLWFQKVTHAQSPVYGEIRWHPKHGQTIAIRGLERSAEEHDVLKALKGLRLLSKAPWQAEGLLPKSKRRKGRTKGSELLGKLNPNQFKREYQELKGEYRRNHLHLPTQADIAEFFNVSRTTLYRFMRHHGIAWPPA